jgi:hypothetical protein
MPVAVATGKYELTVICSRKKSRSSSQFAKVCLAADSFDSRSSSASPIGYDNMTLACRLNVSCLDHQYHASHFNVRQAIGTPHR